jgi:glucose/arabinose dehydrogenase
MGPDGKLYFNIGAPGNIVLPSYMEASIMRVDPGKGTLETVAIGVRNSVGMDFNPKTKDLWFTNHARDWLGDDSPNDTLHRVAMKSPVPHFGYPFCHQGTTLDPEFGKNRSCAEFAKPSQLLGTHIAPLGMKFYSGKMFPAEYQGNIFIAMHGSWNRTGQAGLQRDAREDRRERQGEQADALPHRLHDRREGRSADVGPAGRHPGDARRLDAGVGRLQRHHLSGQLRGARREEEVA